MATEVDSMLWLEDISIAIVDSCRQLETVLAPMLAPLEATVRDAAPGFYKDYVNYTVSNQDPWIQQLKLPFMDPVRAFVIAILYLAVAFGVMGVLRMLGITFGRTVMLPLQVAHNIFLTLLSLFMFMEGVHQFRKLDFNLVGNAVDHTPRGAPMARMLWIFYISKIPEFMDTFIMVLRGNYRQVSFLHVYHHVSVFLIWNFVVSVQSASENSFIHVVMYFYYLLATLHIPFPMPKPTVTLMQIVQFHLMLAQATYQLFVPTEGYPYVLAQILASYMLTLIVLFGNFAWKNYGPPARAARQRQQNSAKKTQ